MCQFNLAIVDAESNNSKLKKVFDQNGLSFLLIENVYLNKQLGFNVKIISPTTSTCDCDSVIGYDTQYIDLQNTEKEIKKQNDKLILLDDELNKWCETIKMCFNLKLTKRFGILTHFYSGTLEDEKIDISTVEELDYNNFLPKKLKEIELDELLLLKINS